MRMISSLLVGVACALRAVSPLAAQEPATWTDDLSFSTFSIAAIDPETGESGVAVTTRVVCVGNAVPWVRAGVGAVATQAWTRMEYGSELLGLLAEGVSAPEALERAVGADQRASRRQIGVIAVRGGGAQHTGDSTNAWAGHRAGSHFVTQGNLLVGPEVLDAVARTFSSSEGSSRHLVDRLIEALAAGQVAGGDARKGRAQSAAVLVADPRPGVARRPDAVTVNISVCEHPAPVAELRRIYDAVSRTLGFRTLQQFAGRAVWQLTVLLPALGYFRPHVDSLERGSDAFRYSQEAIDAVDAFRKAEGLSTRSVGSPSGLVDQAMVERLWNALERAGKVSAVRERLKQWTAIRR